VEMSFVHLHTHSEYSLLEATCRTKALAKTAAAMKMPALALTDSGNMFGAIEFYFACQEAGIKPLIGLEVFLAPGSRFEKKSDRDQHNKGPRHLVLLAQNYKGYQNLCQLSTIGYLEGFYYKPRIDYDVLSEFSENIIALTGGLNGLVPDTFLAEGAEAASAVIRKLKDIFGDRLYLESNRNLPIWGKINQFLEEASKSYGVPVVAANNVHYLTPDDQVAQEVLVCIGTNRILADETRPRLGSGEFYLKSPEQMLGLYRDHEDWVHRTVEVAERIDIQFRLKDEKGKPIYHLPSFANESGTPKEQIRYLSERGLEQRFVEAQVRGEVITEEMKSRYRERLDYELSVIHRMGFDGYFLIVQDFINWAKNNDIPVGPGRGSGAGSLVAYCLRITDLDPLPWNLLFERFLNPERISMPDFDIDFCQDRRQEVIRYVTEKYGSESVSQIITYGRLQARAAIRDVGRVLGMSFQETDAISKLIPDQLNITLKKALELEPRLNEMAESDPKVATLLDLAQRIEGLVRNAGIHAAGVVIANGRLVDHAPLSRGAEGETVVQYDMKNAEKIGLIKFDFLGLKTLTHIRHALDLIEKNRKKKIALQDISIHDPGIYEIMCRGDTLGIFQFEGEGITQAIRQIKPTSFGDITAINALYRPGPMAMIPEFAKRKHGEVPVEYPFPELKPILEDTYGIIVYQEQVMGIASVVAGYSLGEADMLRRAMGKKIKEEMDKHRTRFLDGAQKRGFDLAKAEELFELVYKFADYGFNKSHAAAYCVVAAQTAWLKNYYPVEFYAALLSTELSNTDNIVRYIKDAQKHGITVRAPHVNESRWLFDVEGDSIIYGLGAIKGVGEGVVQAIVEARESLPHKKFSSLDEFFSTVDLKKLNKKVLECLIKAGALDGLGAHRAQLMEYYPVYLERAAEKAKEKESGQASLFDLGVLEDDRVILGETTPWSRSLTLSYEKEVLGFYLSDHPLKGYDKIISVWTTCPISDLKNLSPVPEDVPPVEVRDRRQKDANKRQVTLGGLFTEIREVITKKGTRMAFAKFEDLSGACESVIFPNTYQQFAHLLKLDSPMLVHGLLEIEDGTAKVIVESIVSMEEALQKAKSLTLRLHHLSPERIPALASVLRQNPGPTAVKFELLLPDIGQKVQLEPGFPLNVRISDQLLESVHRIFGRTDIMELRT
ncbi:MAG: DNA polymerase III subunit alpha, partial [Bdellovibrionaceae bacterium]|nr:DNA polymerase III subunit alpha [Pseudobdellovibrionaceae bacterium]